MFDSMNDDKYNPAYFAHHSNNNDYGKRKTTKTGI
jgi:hypothetical protein